MNKIHRILSFNINGAWGEGANSWAMRASVNTAVIQKYRPDLIGLQEVSPTNLKTYEMALSEYQIVPGNKYGDVPPEDQTSILFKKARYELLETGQFWLSETPKVESSGWGVDYPLGVSWVKLRCQESGQSLFHLNTHYEDGPWGAQSRLEGSKVILRQLAQLAPDMPVIATGDFNCNPWSPPYCLFIENGFVDSYRAAGHGDSAVSSTMHLYKGADYFSPDWGNELFWRVDWILVRPANTPLHVTASHIVRDALPPTYPSDHYPIVSEVRFV